MLRDIDNDLADQAVLTIQMLAVDAVEQANSGHPGAPMGLAQVAFEIWTRHLRFDPKEPSWAGRDRFVLSCGHASMLLYGLLHLSGHAVSMEDLKSFRQWGSITPGHPEVHLTPGVETTTGPLGQGIANAAGMAAALKMMAARFPGDGLFSGRVFGLASDGDIMEGVASEACSLAGHLGLGNLIFVYDDNRITIDGSTSLSFSEDVGKRYEAYGWHVQHIDGHDRSAIQAALDAAVEEVERPSLIVARTHIGKGSPNKQDSEESHGSPLGAEEVRLTKEALGWPAAPTFLVPGEVRALFARLAEAGAAERAVWQERLAAFRAAGGEQVALFDQLLDRRVPADLLTQLVEAAPKKNDATRSHSAVVQQRVAALVPSLVGGSADLAGSNKTLIKGAEGVARGAFEGRNLHFGIREHGMAAFASGMSLAGGFIPYVATFLVFSDYLRPALRLAALSRLQVVYVLTHDSVLLGEDGPTHQPVEHYWALRAIPNVDLVRPADALECAAAWAHALRRTEGPTVLSLTRQGLPSLTRPAGFDPEDMLRGAYVLDDPEGEPEVAFIATGSEVSAALEAARSLREHGVAARVVSAPCLDAFERQSESYRAAVLPPGVRRVSVEIGIEGAWRRVVGDTGLVISHDDFGASAPWEVIREKLGFTGPAIAERVRAWLAS